MIGEIMRLKHNHMQKNLIAEKFRILMGNGKIVWKV